jgi:hypothetical protein
LRNLELGLKWAKKRGFGEGERKGFKNNRREIMKTFSQETREQVSEAFNGFCSVEDCFADAVDHHHKLSNTKYYQEKFPLFLQSPFNCAPVCRFHHDNNSQHPELKINEKQAEVYEEFLETLVDVGMAKGRQEKNG